MNFSPVPPPERGRNDAAALLQQDAGAIADAVRSGAASAAAMVQASLDRIEATDGRVNAFTDIVRARALRRAAQVDSSLASAHAARTRELPLLGVPFAVKNLFDIAGLATLAGSKIERDSAPARGDALLVRRLESAGAVLVGALNMDEYAYGFTTENSHVGATRNPHDLSRVAGGSSGGSGAAVAAGQVPLTLGSDTNGSIRVPASLCGVFGLKPTFGRLPRTGSYPFVSSLDHLGPFARSARDLALAYDAMQGPERFTPRDPGCAQRAAEPVAPLLGARRAGAARRRARRLVPPARAARGADRGRHRGAGARREPDGRAADGRSRPRRGLPDHQLGRRGAAPARPAPPAAGLRAAVARPFPRGCAAAGRLGRAGAARAAALRRAGGAAVRALRCAARARPRPCAASPIGTEWFELNGQRLPLRPNMGLLTQPISCIGLPVCAVPVWGAHPSLPIGVQVIAAPWREDLVLRVAAELESAGVVQAPVAPLA